MPWRALAALEPDLARYLNYAVVVLSLVAEILRAYLRAQGGGATNGKGRDDV